MGVRGNGGSERGQARAALIDAVVELGYPEEFGEVLAGELGGVWSMRAMTTYLRNAEPTSPEQVADEMLAILARREAYVSHKVSEHAEASMTAFYNRDRDT